MIKIIAILIILVSGVSIGLTKLSKMLPQQHEFVSGKVPDPKPNGDYKGKAIVTGPWQGKTFDASKSAGINLIKSKGSVTKQFPFKTSVDTGLKDQNVKVLRLDYNLDANPFWLKPVEDELVQTGKNQYLGKLNYRLIPNHPFTFGFFTLEKK